MKALQRQFVSIVILFVLVFSQFAIPQSALAACSGIVYVDSNSVAGSPDGCSWANAFPNLQDALAVAVNGDQIWVADGTYYPDQGGGNTPGDRSASFAITDGVSLYGGFSGIGTNETLLSQRNPDPATNGTVLSGDLGTAADINNPPTGYSDNSYHVVYIVALTNATVVDGFTITKGYANGSGDDTLGGGLYLVDIDGLLTLENLLIYDNRAPNNNGGGMFLKTLASTPDVSMPQITDVTFDYNRAERGGGLFAENSHPVLNNVTFTENLATAGAGGGANIQTVGEFDPPAYAELKNVVFSNNQANGGGGLFVGNSNGLIENVTFDGNNANRRGGGFLVEVSNLSLTNVTFNGNTSLDGAADPKGGGGMMMLDSTVTLNNATFSGNDSQVTGGDAIRSASAVSTSVLTITNSIFWGDTDDEILDDGSGTVTVFDSVVEGGYTGTNILTTDPLLSALADNGGFTETMAIGAGGSAFDAGNNATCASTDQRGVARPQSSGCDMGAYELVSTLQTLNVSKIGNGTGTVTSAPAGIDCGLDCSEDYTTNTVVTLTATADPGSTFTYWSDLDCLDANPCVVTMDSAKSITAMFRIPATLVSPSGSQSNWNNSFQWTGLAGASKYYLELLKADDSLVHRAWYDAATYCSGTDCSVTIASLGSLPNGSYKWRVLDYGPYGPAPFGYGMWTDFTNFSLDAACYTLATSVNIPGSGSVNINTAENCTGGYTAGTVVQVTASPSSGYTLNNWSGDVSGTSLITYVTMDANKSITANMREASATLVSPAGTLSNWDGSFQWTGVTGATQYYFELQKADGTLIHRKWYLASASCSGLNCSVTPPIGAQPNGDYRWRLLDYGAYGYGSWTSFTNFTLDATCYTLTTAVSLPGSGSVTVPAQNCAGGYTVGTVVQVTVVPNSGYSFTDWSGDASGTSLTTSITMNANKSVTANMREASATLVSPIGLVGGWDESFQWTGVTGATRYYFELQTSAGTLVHRRWYQANSSCTGLNCVITPNIKTLAAGDYKWHVLDHGSYGYGSWTEFSNFTIP